MPRNAMLCTTGNGAAALHAALSEALDSAAASLVDVPDGFCDVVLDPLLSHGSVPPPLVRDRIASAIVVGRADATIVDDNYFAARATGRITVAIIGEQGVTIREFGLGSATTGPQATATDGRAAALGALISQGRSRITEAAEAAASAQ